MEDGILLRFYKEINITAGEAQELETLLAEQLLERAISAKKITDVIKNSSNVTLNEICELVYEETNTSIERSSDIYVKLLIFIQKEIKLNNLKKSKK
jgi:hypothetical protein